MAVLGDGRSCQFVGVSTLQPNAVELTTGGCHGDIGQCSCEKSTLKVRRPASPALFPGSTGGQ